ncbi:MAG: phosphate ABC transporter substrate-binding protein [Nitrospirae bacterium]|nr:MAG: phosphate ABC transporter substrate-binding protein [Nitrospirota bacterium]
MTGVLPFAFRAARAAGLFAALLLAARPAAALLRYQGTHILTLGAMQDLGRAFTAATGIPMEVEGGSCDGGLKGVRDGTHALGGMCCPPSRRDLAGLPGRVVPIALDIKVVVVHPSNPVAGLTLEQLRRIQAGEIRSWAEVGGPDAPIAVVYRNHCPQRPEPVLEKAVAGRRYAERGIQVYTSQDLVASVARYEHAIGVVSRLFAGRANVKWLRLEGAEPTPEAVRAGRYPLTGPLSLVVRTPVGPEAAAFLRFLRTTWARSLLERHFIPLELPEGLE